MTYLKKLTISCFTAHKYCRKGVVLVNPATSYSRTLWSKLGPVIARLPQPLYSLGMIPIGLLLLDASQVKGWMGF